MSGPTWAALKCVDALEPMLDLIWIEAERLTENCERGEVSSRRDPAPIPERGRPEEGSSGSAGVPGSLMFHLLPGILAFIGGLVPKPMLTPLRGNRGGVSLP